VVNSAGRNSCFVGGGFVGAGGLSKSDPDAPQEDTQFFAAGLWPGLGFLAIGE